MTIETNGRRINIDIDPLFILMMLGDKVDKKIFMDIAAPNFFIVVRPTKRTRFKTSKGDYDIVIRKDDGEEIVLDMPHCGAKMAYVLTLMCQKVVGGLPNKYFDNVRAVEAIASLYDKLYRSGGHEWVKKCVSKRHNVSTYLTHAKTAIKDDVNLDYAMRYWFGIEEETRDVRMTKMRLRRIRIPSEYILFEDEDNKRITFEELLEQFPPLEELFGYKNKHAECIRELHSQRGG